MLASSIAWGCATGANIVVLLAIARRYRSMPERYPWAQWPNGSVVRWGPKWIVFAAPTLIVLLLACLPPLFAMAPPRGRMRPQAVVLLWTMFIETAALSWWSTQRNLEIAAGTRATLPYREILAAIGVVLTTAAALVAVAAHEE